VKLWIYGALLALIALLALVGQPSGSSRPSVRTPRATVELVDYLPSAAALDGSVDYTVRVQAALDAAAGRTLVLAPFPVLVAPAPGKNYCVRVSKPVAIVGGPGSALIERTGAVQLLRCENVDGLSLDGVTLRGNGGVGRGLGHGTLQVWRCRNVVLRGVHVEDSDADGIAIADSDGIQVLGCVVSRASKAGIYLSNCDRAQIDGNRVLDVVGHVAANGERVGAGVLLLSNRDVVCADNILAGGVGSGILLGAGGGQPAPDGALIAGNLVRGFANPENAQVGCGIQLANVAVEHATRVVVEGTLIRDCGPHGILAENHDACVLRGNTVHASELSGIALARSVGALIEDNVLVDCNQAGYSGQAGVYLHATVSGALVRDTTVVTDGGSPLPAVLDNAPAGFNRVE
jgi:parallel beta-helix repeat protein